MDVTHVGSLHYNFVSIALDESLGVLPHMISVTFC